MAKTKVKFRQAYALLKGKVLQPDTIRSTRWRCIYDKEARECRTWEEWQKRGYSVQKVFVEYQS